MCHTTAFYNSKRYFTSSVRSSSAQQNDKKVPIFKDLTINRQCSSAAAVLVEAKGSCYHYDNLYWTL